MTRQQRTSVFWRQVHLPHISARKAQLQVSGPVPDGLRSLSQRPERQKLKFADPVSLLAYEEPKAPALDRQIGTRFLVRSFAKPGQSLEPIHRP